MHRLHHNSFLDSSSFASGSCGTESCLFISDARSSLLTLFNSLTNLPYQPVLNILHVSEVVP